MTQAGVELVRITSEEDILATMLVSLAKLSSKAPILILEQVIDWCCDDILDELANFGTILPLLLLFAYWLSLKCWNFGVYKHHLIEETFFFRFLLLIFHKPPCFSLVFIHAWLICLILSWIINSKELIRLLFSWTLSLLVFKKLFICSSFCTAILFLWVLPFANHI